MYKKIFTGLVRPSRTHQIKDHLRTCISGNVRLITTNLDEWNVLLTADGYYEGQMMVGDIFIILDGFISNKKDLIAKFSLKENLTDEEVVVKIYERFREEGFEKIAGDYAFVIWDPFCSQLFCVRSPLGNRFLFYRILNDDSVIVSSEISILKQVGEQSNSLDMEYLSNYLVYMETDCFESPYKDIKRLIAGNYLVIDKYKIKNKKFWAWRIGDGIWGLNTKQDYGEAFKELLYKVIEESFDSKKVIGSELSGGLDSSTVTCILDDIMNNSDTKLHTLSQVYDVFKESDERNYIDVVVNEINSKHHPIVFDDQWIMKNIDKLPKYDEPSTVALTYSNASKILESAYNKGVQIMFSGTGGDQLLDWQLYYLADYLRNLKVKSFVNNISAWSKYKGTTIGNLSSIFVLSSLMEKKNLKKYKREWQKEKMGDIRFSLPYTIPSWTNEKFVKEMELIERCTTPKYFRANISKNHILRQVKETVRHGWVDKYVATPLMIHRRNPFLDQRLLEFILNIPDFMFTLPGPIKPLLREAMHDTLPNKILLRGNKTNFNGLFFKGINEEFETITNLSNNMIAEELGIINGEMFRNSIQRWRFGFFGNFIDLVKTFGLELWLRRNL